jgi:hypothetical protein
MGRFPRAGKATRPILNAAIGDRSTNSARRPVSFHVRMQARLRSATESLRNSANVLGKIGNEPDERIRMLVVLLQIRRAAHFLPGNAGKSMKGGNGVRVLEELRSSQLEGRNKPSSSCFDIDAARNFETLTPSRRMPSDTG